jgi:hypothetical protein
MMRWLIGLLLLGNFTLFLWLNLRPTPPSGLPEPPPEIGSLRIVGQTNEATASSIIEEPELLEVPLQMAPELAATGPELTAPPPRAAPDTASPEPDVDAVPEPPPEPAVGSEAEVPAESSGPALEAASPTGLPTVSEEPLPPEVESQPVPGPDPEPELGPEPASGPESEAAPAVEPEAAQAEPAAGTGVGEQARSEPQLVPKPEAPEPEAEERPPPTPDELEAVAPESAAPSPSIVCGELRGFEQEAAATTIAEQLRAAGVAAEVLEAVEQKQTGYWVLIPPAPNRAAASTSLARLEEAKVKDTWLVPAGPLKYAISLGLYTGSGRAEIRAEQIQALGLPAEVRPKINDVTRYHVKYEGDEDEVAPVRAAALAQSGVTDQSLPCK